MKPREQRRRVFVPARLLCDGRWTDVRVLDVSSRGFLVHAPTPPPRGAYVEICRVAVRHVARVVWVGEQRFGVRTQECVAIHDFISPPDATGARPAAPQRDRRSASRRADARQQQFQRSRHRGRLLEYSSMAGCAIAGAALIVGMMQEALAAPLSLVSAALGTP